MVYKVTINGQEFTTSHIGLTCEPDPQIARLKRELETSDTFRRRAEMTRDEFANKLSELEGVTDADLRRRISDLERQLEHAQRSENEACERNMTLRSTIKNLERKLERIRVDLDH